MPFLYDICNAKLNVFVHGILSSKEEYTSKHFFILIISQIAEKVFTTNRFNQYFTLVNVYVDLLVFTRIAGTS